MDKVKNQFFWRFLNVFQTINKKFVPNIQIKKYNNQKFIRQN